MSFALKTWLMVTLALCGGARFPCAHAEEVFQLASGGTVQLTKDGEGDVTTVLFTGSSQWLKTSEEWYSKWHQMPHLQTLTISHTTFDTQLAEYVTQLNIANLEITGDEILVDSNALLLLSKMKSLKRLELFVNNEVDQDCWQFVKNMGGLECLQLLGMKIHEARIEFPIESQINLIEIAGVSNATALNVRNLSQLREARFSNVKDMSTLLKSLSMLNHLEKISISKQY